MGASGSKVRLSICGPSPGPHAPAGQRHRRVGPPHGPPHAADLRAPRCVGRPEPSFPPAVWFHLPTALPVQDLPIVQASRKEGGCRVATCQVLTVSLFFCANTNEEGGLIPSQLPAHPGGKDDHLPRTMVVGALSGSGPDQCAFVCRHCLFSHRRWGGEIPVR